MPGAASNSRKLEILHSIVKAYIDTGGPVASRSVSRARKDNLSAASVRNVMADLCDEGYLAQPHTSAGRVPTEKAFKSYIESLLATNRILATELSRVRTELNRMGTMEDRVERTSHMLTEMTRSVGIAAAIPSASQHLDQIELLTLGDPHRVLMIVVTKDRMVRQRLVTLDEPVSEGELESIRNYVNRNFTGWDLRNVHRELNRRLEEESALYDAILRKLNLLHSKGLLDIEMTPEIHLEGAGNLLGLDLHLTREKMRELFRALEEKKRLVQLLDRFLEHGDRGTDRAGRTRRCASEHARTVADWPVGGAANRHACQGGGAWSDADGLRLCHVGGPARGTGVADRFRVACPSERNQTTRGQLPALLRWKRKSMDTDKPLTDPVEETASSETRPRYGRYRPTVAITAERDARPPKSRIAGPLYCAARRNSRIFAAASSGKNRISSSMLRVRPSLPCCRFSTTSNGPLNRRPLIANTSAEWN